MSLTAGNTKRHASVAFVRGKGALLWAANGSDYLDFSCAYGPIILGYGNEEVNEAAKAQIDRAALFPWATPEIDEVSERILSNFPRSDACLFFKTGSESCAAAARLVRAYTGRPYIIRSGFHGWHDAVVSPFYRWQDAEGISLPGVIVRGIPEQAGSGWLTWDGRDSGALEELLVQHRSQVAGIMIDPVQYREPIAGHLREVRDIATRHQVLMIHDEVKTGFRTSLRGVQGLYEVDADVTVLSKALGNGFPIAAVVCQKQVADLAATVKVKGTYNSELVSVAAARATLTVLERENTPERLRRTGDTLIAEFNKLVARLGLEGLVHASPFRWACMPHVSFTGNAALARFRAERFAEGLLRERIVWLPNHMNYISHAHDEADVGRFLEASSRVLAEAARAQPTAA